MSGWENKTMIIVYVIDSLRFLVEGIFGYLIFNHKKDKNIFKIENLIIFSLIYVSVLEIYNYFLPGNVTYRILAAGIFFAYFCIEAKSMSRWRFFFMYSFFINIAVELIHFMSFEMVLVFTKSIMRIANVKDELDHVMIWLIILFIYSLSIFVIYKLKIIKMQSIREISSYKLMPLISVISLLYLVYIKYCIKHYCRNVYTEEFCWVLSTLLLVVIPIFFLVNIVVNKSIERRNKIKNKDDEEKIRNALERKSLNLLFDMEVEEYDKISKMISKKINSCGIYDSRKGFSDIILSVIIIKYYLQGEKVILSKNVYPKVSEITGNSVKLIDTNIRNIIKEGWLRTDLEVIAKEYTKPVDAEKGYPTAREFLIYIASTIENWG